MKKLLFFVACAILMALLVPLVQAQSFESHVAYLLETPRRAFFYVHADRPPEVLDGPSFFDRASFDKILKGDNDRFVGESSSNEALYLDERSGCFYRTSSTNQLYHLDLVGGESDAFYGFTPTFTWRDGSMLENVPFVYDPRTAFFNKCADVRPAKKALRKKLKLTGTVKGTSLKVYEPALPKSSGELKKLYENSVFPEDETALSFNEFVARHPLVYIDDQLGSFHRLLNTKYAPAAEMGKPALYLYPEKDTTYNVTVTPVGGRITVQIPTLEKNTWKGVLAKPSGELTLNNSKYPYLYYESTTNQAMPITQGVVMEQQRVPEELGKMLDTIGFKAHEKREFLDYWLPRMNSRPYYAIQWMFNGELDKYSKLSIAPNLPIRRAFLNFRGLSKPVKLMPQMLPTLNRSMPHAFEWGGNNLAQ